MTKPLMMKANKLPVTLHFGKMGTNAIVAGLGSETLTVVEVANQNSGAEMIRFSARSLPPDGLNAIWLKAIWHQEHFSRRRLIFCLPADWVSYKTLLMPELPLAQLEEAVKIELESENGPRQAGIVKIIEGRKQDAMLAVNVAIVEREQLSQTLQIFKQAGLEVEWSGLRFQGLRNFINFNAGFFEDSSEGVVYLDFGAAKTELGIVQDELVVYRRELSFGGLELLKDESGELTDDFLEELRLSLAAYQAGSKKKIPPKIGVYGGSAVIAKIGTKLRQELGLPSYVPERSKLSGVLTHKFTSGLAPLIGLALEKAGVMKQEAQRIYTPEQDNFRIKREQLMVGLCGGLSVFLLVCGIMLGLHANMVKQAQTNRWLNQHSAQLSNLRRLEQQTNRNTARIKQLNVWLAGQNRELEFLLLLANNLPEGTQISDLTIENGVVKDLSGLTPSASLMLNKFKNVAGLKELKLKGTITSSLQGEIFQLEGAVNKKEPPKK